PEMAEMSMRYGIAFCLQLGDGTLDGPIGASPAQHEQIAFGRTAVELLWRNMICYPRYFFFPDLDHELVILGIVADVTGDILFFQTADAVFKTGSPGYRPGPHQLFIPQIRLKFLFPVSELRLKMDLY